MTDRPRRAVLATGIYPPEVGGPATHVRFGGDDERVWVDANRDHLWGSRSTQDGWKVMAIGRHGGVPWRYFRYAFCVWKQGDGGCGLCPRGVSEGLPGTVGALWLEGVVG